MSFTDMLTKDSLGHVWLLEVSNDDFSTIAHRWATHACHFGAERFDPRIVKIGPIQKAFGLDGFATVSTVTLVLDNTVFDMDWLVDVSSGPIEFTYRFRLSLGLFDPNTIPTTEDVEPTAQVMGIFGMLDSPQRDSASVTLSLADDGMGLFNELATSPTINDWIGAGTTTVDNNILYTTIGPAHASIDFDTPLPIVFEPTAVGLVASLDGTNNGGTLAAAGYTHAIIICATTSTDNVTDEDVFRLNATFRPDVMLGTSQWDQAGSTITMPTSVTVSPGDILSRPAGTYTIWSVQKSATITKDGHSWKILWVAFNAAAWMYWATNHNGFGYISGYAPDGSSVGTHVAIYPFWTPTGQNNNSYAAIMAAFDHFTATGFPFSAVTDKSSIYQYGVNVLRDLVSNYSHGSSANVDGAAFDTALKSNMTLVSQTLLPLPVNASSQRKFLSPVAAAIAPGQLRQAIGDLAQSIGVDTFFTWDGLFSVAGGWFDFDNITTPRLSVDELLMQNITERKPSQGERWAFFNRLYIQGPDGVVRGPYDNADSIAEVGVAIPKTIVGKWLLADVAGVDPTSEWGPWQVSPRLESKQRNLVNFQTDKSGLLLDLGILFNLTWTRGNTQAVYTGAVFRPETIALDPSSLAVTMECVWVDDIQSVNPYLLDDESLVLFVGVGYGGRVSVTDGSTTVTFIDGDDPINDFGMAAGDILVLLDATQASNVFTRYRALRIASVTNSTVVIASSDLDFSAPSGANVTSWQVVHGKTTYPTDPTDYPNGNAMYGKVSNASGVFSDSTAGNQLLDG